MNVREYSNDKLIQFVRRHCSAEQKERSNILRGLAEIERRQATDDSESNEFLDALPAEVRYCESTTHRRAPIVKMLARLSEPFEDMILDKIGSGSLKLGHLALFAENINDETAHNLVALIEGKKLRELEKIAAKMFPMKRHKARKNKFKGLKYKHVEWVDKNGNSNKGLEIRTTFVGDSLRNLERLKELHQGKSLDQILEDAIEDSLRKRDPGKEGKKAKEGEDFHSDEAPQTKEAPVQRESIHRKSGRNAKFPIKSSDENQVDSGHGNSEVLNGTQISKKVGFEKEEKVAASGGEGIQSPH